MLPRMMAKEKNIWTTMRFVRQGIVIPPTVVECVIEIVAGGAGDTVAVRLSRAMALELDMACAN